MGRRYFHHWDNCSVKLAGHITQPSIAFHKGSFQYVQRVRIPHRGQGPSSVTQLPILTALHARFPTLFVIIIHEIPAKVNPLFHFFHLRKHGKLTGKETKALQKDAGNGKTGTLNANLVILMKKL